MQTYNCLMVGATRQGKSLTAARKIIETPSEACVLGDPHKDSVARSVAEHFDGLLLLDRLSDLDRTLGYEFLRPSKNPNPTARALENLLQAEALVDILLRRRNAEGVASTPLLEEWLMAGLTLFLNQKAPMPLAWLPSIFLPISAEFQALVRGCVLPEIAAKFRELEKLPPRALRAEVGSTVRLVEGVFRNPAFTVRSRGGFDLAGFLQRRGKQVVERGEDIGDDAVRTIIGAITLLTIAIAKRRASPLPHFRIYLDECTNAGLAGRPELRGLAETNKNGLYWTLMVQNLDFPGGPSAAQAVLQNCLRHEWFGCPSHALARIAATDIVAGLAPVDDVSRAERIARLTDEIMTLPPGWRWVREPRGSWKEYVPLLESPWPDWPGLRAAKFKEKLAWIYGQPEYRAPATGKSSNTSTSFPPPPNSSPSASSPAQRWKRPANPPTDASPSSGEGDF